jgi:hypothetical protein
MRRTLTRRILPALLGLGVAAAVYVPVSGHTAFGAGAQPVPACAQIDLNGNPVTTAGYTSIDPFSGATIPTVTGILTVKAPTCVQDTYAIEVYGADSHGNFTQLLVSERILGDGTDPSLYFGPTHLPASLQANPPGTVCIGFSIRHGADLLHQSPPTQAGGQLPGCFQFAIDSSPGLRWD